MGEASKSAGGLFACYSQRIQKALSRLIGQVGIVHRHRPKAIQVRLHFPNSVFGKCCLLGTNSTFSQRARLSVHIETYRGLYLNILDMDRQ